MSDILATSSFFPTPHEIAGGIKWVREHPVVVTAAAAAATAVSVITYLRARAISYEEDPVMATEVVERTNHDRQIYESETLPPPDHYPYHSKLVATSSIVFQKTQGLALETIENDSNTDSEVSATSHITRISSPTSVQALCDIDKDAYVNKQVTTDDPIDDSASPHWGWYVSTTPPEERY